MDSDCYTTDNSSEEVDDRSRDSADKSIDADEDEEEDSDEDDDTNEYYHELVNEIMEFESGSIHSINNILSLIRLVPSRALQETRHYRGYHVLHFACRCVLHDEILFRLIERCPAAASKANKHRQFPLHIASRYQSSAVIMRLIEAYPKAAQKVESRGWYPLGLALKAKKTEEVILKLIEVSPKAASARYTKKKPSLHMACQKAHSKATVAKLIEVAPSLLQESDYEGSYPIHHALASPSMDAIKLIIDSDPLALQRQNDKGAYAIHHVLACLSMNFQLTMDSHPLPTQLQLDNSGVSKLDYLMQLPNIQINVRDGKGQTPLHHACSRNLDQAVVKLLTHPDIDVNARDNRNETPLHKVVSIYCIDGSGFDQFVGQFFALTEPQVLEPLLNHPFILINERNTDDQTPLEVTIQNINRLEKLQCQSNQPRINHLTKIQHLLEEFPTKRRWLAYQYFFDGKEEDLKLQLNEQSIYGKKRNLDDVFKM